MGARLAPLGAPKFERGAERPDLLYSHVGFERTRHLCILFLRTRILLSARLAERPRQALRENGEQRVSKTEWIETHVDEAGNRLGRAVRVECGDDEVPGQRGLDGGRGSLLIAHFAD